MLNLDSYPNSEWNLTPRIVFGNKQGSGVGKFYLNDFIVRLIRNNDHPLPYWSFFFILVVHYLGIL